MARLDACLNAFECSLVGLACGEAIAVLDHAYLLPEADMVLALMIGESLLESGLCSRISDAIVIMSLVRSTVAIPFIDQQYSGNC